jgi:hypothetical protein
MALSEAQLAQLWIKAGGNPNYAVVMAKIAKRESGGNPTATNLKHPDHSIGLWQINQLAHKGTYGSDQALMSPLQNAKAAVAIFRSAKQAWGDPLKPWSTHNPAIDSKYIGAQAPIGAEPPKPSKPVRVSVPQQAGQQKAGLIASYLSNQHAPDALTSLATGLLAMGVPKQVAEKAVPATGKPGTSPSVAVPGSAPDEIRTLMERANKIDRKHLPYVWGGGHSRSGVPDRGTGRDPGIGFDCSGAVAAVLGVDPRHSSQFALWGKPGRAKGGKGVTVYANGTHVLMEINGHFWGTSRANPRGGAGWIPRSAISESYLSGFTARHL